ncbi:MAG: UbiA family prenyltransferase [Verrucomicrobia bacterium]|nr:UbiA family prenyltransferase [Verrucomicrobiota bacterium]MBT7065931.1 UbiA family prenyltransferase [Verrucomicrobiota bacterium]MBT7699449.1 UbiA family prenyltransferase [Verrucomicrobiota bacterium]
MPATPTLRAWLQLIRLPNLLTVPGDPLAGACLALAIQGGGRLTPALMVGAASLAFYTAGLIINDCCDLKEDRRQRPDRPLPSGHVARGHALGASLLLIVLALGLAWRVNPLSGATAGALSGMILLYNLLLKRSPLPGALAMGLCRGLSLLLGATAVGTGRPGGMVLAAALLLTLYISAVTLLADREHEAVTLGGRRWWPLVAGVALLVLLLVVSHGWGWLSLLPATVAGVSLLRLGGALRGTPAPQIVQSSIGRYIRLLLLVQAALCFVQFPAGTATGVVLCLLWPLSGRLGRWFYAS